MAKDLFERAGRDLLEGSGQTPSAPSRGNPNLAAIIDLIEASGLPAAGGGILQGLGNTAISAANLPLELLTGSRIPHLDLKGMAPEGLGSDIGFAAGDIGGSILGFLAGSGAIGSLGRGAGLSRASGMKGIAQDVALNSGLGYLFGENAAGEGRGLSAALAGTLGALFGNRKGAIAQRISKDAQKATKAGGREFQGILEEGADKGAEFLRKGPKINEKLLKSALPNQFKESLKNFSKNPTVENAHWLQSDLNKWGNKVASSVETGKAASNTIAAYNEANRVSNSLVNAIKGNLNRASGGLGDAYGAARANWAKNVAPYGDPALKNFANKLGTPKKVLDSLAQNDLFQRDLASKYPEIGLNEIATKLGNYGALAGTGAFGVTKGKDWLEAILHNND